MNAYDDVRKAEIDYITVYSSAEGKLRETKRKARRKLKLAKESYIRDIALAESQFQSDINPAWEAMNKAREALKELESLLATLEK